MAHTLVNPVSGDTFLAVTGRQADALVALGWARQDAPAPASDEAHDDDPGDAEED